MRGRAAGISGQLPGHGVQIGEEFVVVEMLADGAGAATPVTVRANGGAAIDVTVSGRRYAIAFTTALRDVAVHGSVDGQPFCAQIERVGLNNRITHHGLQRDLRVLSPRAAELMALMPHKPPPDLSKFLLSPMPGLLADVAVQPGQTVRAGEKLAVIEAMKMENILVAAQDGVVAKVVAAKGESLAVDQVILEFA